jgi:hypothetical protein
MLSSPSPPLPHTVLSSAYLKVPRVLHLKLGHSFFGREMKVATDIPLPMDSPSHASSSASSTALSLNPLITPVESPNVSSKTDKLAAKRQPSSFDPMGMEDEMEDEGYGELGNWHPLRRVKEESPSDKDDVKLPGIQSLFGVARRGQFFSFTFCCSQLTVDRSSTHFCVSYPDVPCRFLATPHASIGY